MAIKSFSYNILDLDSPKLALSNEHEFSLVIADKAKYLVHRAIKNSAINQTQFTSSTKTRSEVNGGGRKPWKQKGTGRARAGSIRSPLWRGGGVIFGPKVKNITKKINKKEKQLALRTILYNKQKQFKVFNTFQTIAKKTALIQEKLLISNLQEHYLIISSKPNANLKLSLRNLQNCEYILANQLNVKVLTKAQHIIVDQISLQIIQETYCD